MASLFSFGSAPRAERNGCATYKAQRGISESRIDDYQRKYEFLREVLVVLDEQQR